MNTFFLNIYYSFCKVESVFYHKGNTTAFSSLAMLEMMVSLEFALSSIITTLLSFLPPLRTILADNIYGYFFCFIGLSILIHLLRKKYIWKDSFTKELNNQENEQQRYLLWFIIGLLFYIATLVFAVWGGFLLLTNSP